MIGKTLSVRYEVGAQVGESALFITYSARDRLNGRNVSIREFKDPFNQEPDFIRSMVEILPSIQLSHPAIEMLYEIVEEEGQHYLIAEMPKGSLLTERIRRFAPFTAPVSLATAIGIVEALDVLHDHGISHGDVGAHNVIATHDGSAKLQLGGLWQTYPSSRRAAKEVLPQMAPYLAPEVCQGSRPSAQSDMYGVGIILFQLLTGQLPFVGETPTATTMRHQTSTVPSLRGLNAAIPVAVEQLVNRLLAKTPEQRFESTKQLLAELRTISDQIRFGKTAAPKPSSDVASPVIEPVAPRASSSKEPAKKTSPVEKPKKERKPKRERDIPTWLLAVMALVLIGAVASVFAFVAFLAQKPREISMPNIKGSTVNQAKAELKKLKINLRVVSKEPNEKIDLDRILRSSPEQGRPIREGGTVDVTVSSGTRTVAVPDLLGLTADEAREALGALNLSLDGKPSRINGTGETPGSIIKQLPRANEIVARPSRIRVWIAARPEDPPDSLPGEAENEDGVKSTARSFLVRHKIKDVRWRVTVRVEMKDESGDKVVYEKDHEPGDTVTIREIGFGEKADFRIYYDGELKEEQTVERAGKTTKKATVKKPTDGNQDDNQ